VTPTRYGIYLRPDPVTCWVQAQTNMTLKQQYGLISAAAFPPHATLVGSLKTDASIADIVDRVEHALIGKTSFTVHNKGLETTGDGYVFNVHENGNGEPNQPFIDTATAIKAAILPIALPTEDFLVTPVAEAEFWGHLSLASHDLSVDRTLYDEVGEFLAELLAGLPTPAPEMFSGRTVVLYGTDSDDWEGQWWRTHRYQHLKTWTLPDPGAE